MRVEEQSGRARESKLDLTIVIPSFDSAEWLPSTIRGAVGAAAGTPWSVDIVVVDDGSTDQTAEVLQGIASSMAVPMRVLRQRNAGRFLARWAGVEAATAPLLLLLDSRVVLGADSLRYLHDHYSSSGATCWNGHVPTDTSVPLVGRFWEVPTHVFWGGYLAHPRPTMITATNFDRVPKGTGCLVVPRELFLEVSRANWPEGDPRFVSDDTRLLREIVSRTPGIMLDPGFSASYRPRTSVAAFLRHAHLRGSLFVDSYARTGRARDIALVALLAVPPVAIALVLLLVALQAWADALSLVAVILVAVVGVLPLIALARSCAPRAALAFVVYSVPFVSLFWSGLVRGAVERRRPHSKASP